MCFMSFGSVNDGTFDSNMLFVVGYASLLVLTCTTWFGTSVQSSN